MIPVLVVSDHPVVRAGLVSMLNSSTDCRVVGESTLDELEDQLSILRPDIVLLDLADETEQIEVVRGLAGDMPALNIVVLSRDLAESQVRQVLRAGVRGFLHWDAPSEEIVEAVRAVNSGLMVLDPAVTQVLLVQPPSPVGSTAGENLTPRELEVLQMLAEGLPSKTIATRLSVSEHTVKFHVGSILAKLGAASRTEAVMTAIRRGLISV